MCLSLFRGFPTHIGWSKRIPLLGSTRFWVRPILTVLKIVLPTKCVRGPSGFPSKATAGGLFLETPVLWTQNKQQQQHFAPVGGWFASPMCRVSSILGGAKWILSIHNVDEGESLWDTPTGAVDLVHPVGVAEYALKVSEDTDASEVPMNSSPQTRGGLIKRIFTWDDHLEKPLKRYDTSTKWEHTHGRLGAEAKIDQSPLFVRKKRLVETTVAFKIDEAAKAPCWLYLSCSVTLGKKGTPFGAWTIFSGATNKKGKTNWCH